jgi:hypothetical protein
MDASNLGPTQAKANRPAAEPAGRVTGLGEHKSPRPGAFAENRFEAEQVIEATEEAQHGDPRLDNLRTPSAFA